MDTIPVLVHLNKLSAFDGLKIQNVWVGGRRGDIVVVAAEDNSVHIYSSGGRDGDGKTPEKTYEKRDLNVRDVAFGDDNILLMSTLGNVYEWRNPIQCEDYTDLFNEIAVPDNKKIVAVSCGSRHRLALTSEGSVYGWGANTSRQVYTYRHIEALCKMELQIYPGSKTVINKIACGEISSHALTSKGNVYNWGDNQSYQLGGVMKNNDHQNIISGHNFVNIVCGAKKVLAITRTGNVYGWGQFKCDLFTQPVLFEIRENSPKMTAIAALWYSNICLTKTGSSEIYVWDLKNITVNRAKLIKFKSFNEAFSLYSTPAVTFQPIEVQKESDSFLSSIEKSFDDNSFKDLTIIIEGKSIYVNKAVLASRCVYFSKMFQDEFKEHKKGELNINFISYNAYRAFIKFLYTNKLDATTPEVAELLTLADLYCHDELKELCLKILFTNVNVDNVCTLYEEALRLKSKKLENACLAFARDNKQEVFCSKQFTLLERNIMVQFIQDSATEVTLL